MDVLEAIESRVNVKVYDKRDVPEELVSQILMAGTLAPSAGDVQPWEFIIVKDKKLKTELFIASLRQRHVEDAPLVIAVCANLEKVALKFNERGKSLYSIQDTGAAIQNMLLAAHSLGLGGAWVHAFDEALVKELLKIPDKLRPIAILTFGFPLSYEKYYKSDVIPFENISWFEEYGKQLPWTFQYTFNDRFGINKTITETFNDIKDKAMERTREMETTPESVATKTLEKPKENLSSRFVNFIKKLGSTKT